MLILYIILIIAFLLLVTLYILYSMVFKKKIRGGLGLVKKSIRYDKFKEVIKSNINRIQSTPSEVVTIVSDDNYELNAKYYHHTDGAPVAIFFHGYRSYAEFDGNFLFQIFRQKAYNILMVNQRAHGDSKARSLTFGVKESEDCVLWADYIAGRFGSGTKIILSGMSMGASTVLMASDKSFKGDVRGIIADCGFSSPREALHHVIRSKCLPVKITYFFIRLAAIVFAGFDPDSKTAASSLAQSDLPVLIIHGDKDSLVPYEMGVSNYNAAKSKKKLVTVHGAGHAISGGVEPVIYAREINKFLDEII